VLSECFGFFWTINDVLLIKKILAKYERDKNFTKES
jgi:hypothetical protein